MFHRILETFFFIQVLAEQVLEGASHCRDDAFEAVKDRAARLREPFEKRFHNHHDNDKKTKTQREAKESTGYKSYQSSQDLHTFKDLPGKFSSLFRQFSRYVFISFLGAILGKS